MAMETLGFATFKATAPSSSSRAAKFCAQGCVKCSPASLSLRSADSLASSRRSECSSSSSASTPLRESQFHGEKCHLIKTAAAAKATTSTTRSTNHRTVRALFASENSRDPDTQINVTKEEPTRQVTNSHALASLRPPPPRLENTSNGVPSNGAIAEPSQPSSDITDEIWLTIRAEARLESEKEPALASYFYSSVISHRSLERALAFHLSNKLSNPTLLSTQLFGLIIDILHSDAAMRAAIREDLKAVRSKDPACSSYCQCLLYFKGFLSCQAHRVSHWLWSHGRPSLAFLIQSRVSEVFHVDIHPAAKIGSGVLFDHATGLVVGETATIGSNVSILHNVTLGGTGSTTGDRHPKIGDGVLIGAGAILLGNIKIGEGAKIGSGSLVLIDVPSHTTAVGNPARLIGGKQSPTKLKEIPSETMDHTIKGWSDYVI